jgi:hypothetical protein
MAIIYIAVQDSGRLYRATKKGTQPCIQSKCDSGTKGYGMLEDEKVIDRKLLITELLRRQETYLKYSWFLAFFYFVHYLEECEKICQLRYDGDRMYSRKDDQDESIYS